MYLNCLLYTFWRGTSLSVKCAYVFIKSVCERCYGVRSLPPFSLALYLYFIVLVFRRSAVDTLSMFTSLHIVIHIEFSLLTIFVCASWRAFSGVMQQSIITVIRLLLLGNVDLPNLFFFNEFFRCFHHSICHVFSCAESALSLSLQMFSTTCKLVR